MRVELCAFMLALALCLAGATAEVVSDVPGPPAESPAPAEQGTLVRDAASLLEFRLPAAYWEYLDQRRLAAQARPGCMGPQMPQSMLFVVHHKDAPVALQCQRGDTGLLMRSKDDLEGFVRGFADTIRGQVGDSLGEFASEYEERGPMLIHRMAITLLPAAGGGCAMQGQPPGPQEKTKFIILLCFVRPKGTDTTCLKLFAGGPAEAFDRLGPELNFILSSLRYTGPAEESVFVPDAPPDKVVGPAQGARAAGKRGFNYGLLVAMGMVIAVWLLMRRRKPATP